MRTLPRWAVPLVLATVIAAAYSNGLDVPFAFDDWHAVEQNPAIRDLSQWPRYFTDPTTFSVLRENRDLRPLLVLSLALNHRVSGLAPWSYHLVNLALHWLVCLLVYRIVRDHLWLGPGEAGPVALAAALLVAVHPLNTEPVNYVSSRSALLTTACYLGAFDAAVRRRWGLAYALGAAAMLTKSIAVTLPVALAMYLLLDRTDRRTAFPRAPFAGLTAVVVAGIAYRLWLLPAWIFQTTRQADVTPLVYFRTQWSALLYYLRLFLWPNALVIDRLDYPWSRSWGDVQAWGSLLAIALIAAVVWRLTRVRRAFAFAALWVPITLAAESSVFPLAEAVNEHRPYLAMLGLATFAALAIWLVAGAAARRYSAPAPWLFAVVVTGLVSLLGAATYARTEVWRDPLTLWTDATRKAPRNPRAWLNAGHTAMARGDLRASRTMLMEAHRLSPCYAYVQMNLAALEAREGRPQESLRWADEAVRCNPGLALAHLHRAEALERLGRGDDALTEYREATRIDPAYAEAWQAQGRLLEARGDWRAALGAYDRALALDPTNADAAMRGALLLHYRLDDPAAAVERYRRVLAANPLHYGAHYQLAVALLATGRRDEALAIWAKFVPMAQAIGDDASIAQAPAELRAGR
jgi:tetratricopeptide (TPR) repeat protein